MKKHRWTKDWLKYQKETHNWLQKHRLSDYLSPREEKILRMRYGLEHPNDDCDLSKNKGAKFCNEFHTLKEISQVFGVEVERIRRIEAKALQKIMLRKD